MFEIILYRVGIISKTDVFFNVIFYFLVGRGVLVIILFRHRLRRQHTIERDIGGCVFPADRIIFTGRG